MVIETRIAGKKARALDRWSVTTPPGGDSDGDGGITLRDLIARVVRSEVSAFETREQARRLIRVLSDTEIAEGAARGKVDSGGREPTGPVDEGVAVGAALQGFDGRTVPRHPRRRRTTGARHARSTFRPDSQLVFLRLTFLAGA